MPRDHIKKLVEGLQEQSERLVEDIQGHGERLVGDLQGHGERLVGDLQERTARHKERNRPSGYDFALADHIDMLNPAHWDQVTAGGSLFLQRDYLKHLAERGPDELSGRYAIVYEGTTPRAAVAAQVVELSAEKFVATQETNTAERLQAALLREVRDTVLVCGNLLSSGCHGVAFAPDADPAEVWAGVAEALYRLRRADKLRGQPEYVLVKDIPEPLHEQASTLARYSYRPIEGGAEMVLDLRDWTSFDDYTASLTSRYRRTVRKIDRQIEQAGCEVAPLDDLWPHRHELHALYMNVVSRAGARPTSMTPDYLAGLKTIWGDRFRCTVIRRDTSILGFVTTILDGDTAIGYYLGIDYDANADLPLYHRLLQQTIADGLDGGCRRVSMGRTALEPKARLGATAVPLRMWMRHRVAALNVVMREFFSLVPYEEPPERNPFKDEPADS